MNATTKMSLQGLPSPIQSPSRRRRGSGRQRRGRVWLNGRELGGTEPRFAHLAAVYD
jgi:hypothetical protein